MRPPRSKSETDGRAVTRLWRREEIEQIEDYLDYVKSQDSYRVDPEDTGDSSTPEPEPE